MKVIVVWAAPQAQDVVVVEVPSGATVADAVALSRLLVHYGLDPGVLGYAIFGRRAPAHTRLAEGDRVELTRPLAADPKDRRRHRAGASHSAKPPKRVQRRPGR